MRALLAAAALAVLLVVPARAAAPVPIGLDIGRWTVNGKPLAGRTIPEVTRIFGRPDGYYRTQAFAYVRYGDPLSFSLLVLFRPRGNDMRATETAFQSPELVEVRTGRLLLLRPQGMQRTLAAAYRASYRLADPYRCRGGGECFGRFDALAGRRHLTFGLAGGRQFLRVWEG